MTQSQDTQSQQRRRQELEEAAARGNQEAASFDLLSRVLVVSGGSDKNYERLRNWYLASLRRAAIEASSAELTPATLVAADKQAVSSRIAEKEQSGQAVQIRLGKSGKAVLGTILVVVILQVVFVGCVYMALSADQERLAPLLGSWALFSLASGAALWLVFHKMVLVKTSLTEAQLEGLSRGQFAAEPASQAVADVYKAFRQLTYSLAESCERERSIADYALDLICSCDLEHRFLAVSPTSQRLWGYSQEDLCGRGVADVIVSEDVDKTLAIMEKTRQAKGRSVSFENRVRRRSGDFVHMLWTIEWSDKEQLLFCVAEDITVRKLAELALKASEERLSLVLQNLPVGVVTLSNDGSIEAANPVAGALLLPGEDGVTGKTLSQLVVSEQGNLDDDLAGLQPGKPLVRRLVRPDQSAFAASLTLTEYEFKGGKKRLLMMEDITERFELEQMKRDFVSMVSHDLRTPLMSVLGFLNMVSAGVYGSLSEAGEKKVAATERNVGRLIALINDLLDIDKLEAGGVELHIKATRLSSLVDSSLDAVSDFASKKGIGLQTIGESELMVNCDSERVVQVIINFLSNAIKFSPPGAKVCVETSLDTGTGKAKLAVIDSGPGIPEDKQADVFERFKQLKGGKEAGGTGLGLAICKMLIEQHSGEIGVVSQEGMGSSFWFTLPTG